jgi:hypothetical protein
MLPSSFQGRRGVSKMRVEFEGEQRERLLGLLTDLHQRYEKGVKALMQAWARIGGLLFGVEVAIEDKGLKLTLEEIRDDLKKIENDLGEAWINVHSSGFAADLASMLLGYEKPPWWEVSKGRDEHKGAESCSSCKDMKEINKEENSNE